MRDHIVIGLHGGTDFGPHGFEGANLLVFLLNVKRAKVNPEEGETSDDCQAV